MHTVVVCFPGRRGELGPIQGWRAQGPPPSVVVGAGLWFKRRWDHAEFQEALRKLCGSASPGPDWGSVADRIGRMIPWEFDNRYDNHVNQHYGDPFPPAPVNAELSLRPGVSGQSAVELSAGWRRRTRWRLKGWASAPPPPASRQADSPEIELDWGVSLEVTDRRLSPRCGRVERQHPAHFGGLSRWRLVAPHHAVVDLSVDVERPI